MAGEWRMLGKIRRKPRKWEKVSDPESWNFKVRRGYWTKEQLISPPSTMDKRTEFREKANHPESSGH